MLSCKLLFREPRPDQVRRMQVIVAQVGADLLIVPYLQRRNNTFALHCKLVIKLVGLGSSVG